MLLFEKVKNLKKMMTISIGKMYTFLQKLCFFMIVQIMF